MLALVLAGACPVSRRERLREVQGPGELAPPVLAWTPQYPSWPLPCLRFSQYEAGNRRLRALLIQHSARLARARASQSKPLRQGPAILLLKQPPRSSCRPLILLGSSVPLA